MRVVEIPILGRPLAGKTTVLFRARDAFGGQLQWLDFQLQADDVFRGLPCRLAVLHIRTESFRGELWCIPGGAAPEWIVPLLPHQSPALFVFDNQQSIEDQHAWFEVQAPHVDLERSISIVTKRDLEGRVKTVEPLSVIPAELRHRPFIYISSLDPRSTTEVQRLLGEHLDLFAQSPGVRSQMDRSAVQGG